MIQHRIDDEGEYFELLVCKDGHQFSAFIVDVEPLGVDQSYSLALGVLEYIKSALGDGGGSAPYRPGA
jgi:hypothetical protein